MMIVAPAWRMTGTLIRRGTIRRLRARRSTITIRPYSTGGRPPTINLLQLINSTTSAIRDFLYSTATVEQITPVTPVPNLPTLPEKQPTQPERPSTPWAGEGSWVAIDKNGGKCFPAPLDWFYRAHDVPPDVLFRDGMPAPGNDFDLKRHQGRWTRDGTDDAFYGGCSQAAWRGTDEGGWDGPAFDTTSRYMSVIRDAWAYGPIGDQLGSASPPEYELVVHIVPPEKIVAVFDKVTGEIYINEKTPKEIADKVTERLKTIWAIGLRLGIYTPSSSEVR